MNGHPSDIKTQTSTWRTPVRWVGRSLQLFGTVLLVIAIAQKWLVPSEPHLGEGNHRPIGAAINLYAGSFAGVVLFALGSYISTKTCAKKPRGKDSEVFHATLIITAVTILLAAMFTAFHEVESVQEFPGLFGMNLTFSVFLVPDLAPFAFVMALLISSMKRFALMSLAIIFIVTVICSSVAVGLLGVDIFLSRADRESGQLGWLFSRANLYGIISAFTATLLAFAYLLKQRKRIAKIMSPVSTG